MSLWRFIKLVIYVSLSIDLKISGKIENSVPSAGVKYIELKMASQQSEDFPPHGIQGIKKPCRACSDFKTWTTNLNQNADVKEKIKSQVKCYVLSCLLTIAFTQSYPIQSFFLECIKVKNYYIITVT